MGRSDSKTSMPKGGQAPVDSAVTTIKKPALVRAPRVAPASIPAGNAQKVCVRGLPTGELMALVVSSKFPDKPAFLGGFPNTVGIPQDSLANALKIHAVKNLRDPEEPEKLKEIPLPNDPSRFMRWPLFIHILEDPAKNTAGNRKIYASNIAKALNEYSSLNFQYKSEFQFGLDLTTPRPHDAPDCLGNYLTFDDTMWLLVNSIFVNGDTKTILEDKEIMLKYFGRDNVNRAKKHFEAKLVHTDAERGGNSSFVDNLPIEDFD